MIQEKIYEIAGVKCRINFDQTLREVKEIDDMVARCGGYDLTLEDTERFLSIVLKAESPVDMLDIKESQLTDVMAEYFGKKKNLDDQYGRKLDIVRARGEWLESEIVRLRKAGKRYLNPDTSELESLIYFLSDGDITKRNLILDTPYALCMEYFYLKKLHQLNEAIANLPTED